MKKGVTEGNGTYGEALGALNEVMTHPMLVSYAFKGFLHFGLTWFCVKWCKRPREPAQETRKEGRKATKSVIDTSSFGSRSSCRAFVPQTLPSTSNLLSTSLIPEAPASSNYRPRNPVRVVSLELLWESWKKNAPSHQAMPDVNAFKTMFFGVFFFYWLLHVLATC